jgi:hypothetical protein
MIHTVLMFPVCAAAGRQAHAIAKNKANFRGICTSFMDSLSFLGIATPAALKLFDDPEERRSVANTRLVMECEGSLKGA